ncbi:MAG TPA: hypothetical protein VES95_13790 [Dermatophilaceae bacterium]|nr:hypothetical protein [Dermatophilaceae bacterium]
MGSSAIVPVWLAAGTPLLAFVGVLVGYWVTRRAATELETRSTREETMRTLKWAAELAVSGDDAKADLGLRELYALRGSALLDPEQRTFIAAALASVYARAAATIEAAVEEGQQVEVVVPEAEPPHAGSGRASD